MSIGNKDDRNWNLEVGMWKSELKLRILGTSNIVLIFVI